MTCKGQAELGDLESFMPCSSVGYMSQGSFSPSAIGSGVCSELFPPPSQESSPREGETTTELMERANGTYHQRVVDILFMHFCTNDLEIFTGSEE